MPLLPKNLFAAGAFARERAFREALLKLSCSRHFRELKKNLCCLCKNLFCLCSKIRFNPRQFVVEKIHFPFPRFHFRSCGEVGNSASLKFVNFV